MANWEKTECIATIEFMLFHEIRKENNEKDKNVWKK